MNALQYVLILACSFMIFSAVLLILVPVFLRPTPTEERLGNLVRSKREELRIQGFRERFEAGLLDVSRSLRTKLGIDVGEKSLERLHRAGYRKSSDPEMFFSAQWGLPILGMFVGSFAPENTLFWSFVGAVVGYLLPNMWVSYAISRRKDNIRRSLPDVVDLLVICVEAGLGLDQALLRVINELQGAYPDIEQELSRVQLEQRAGKPRLEAWQDFANRIQIRELASFAGMLTQTERFGTPIVRALRQFADELRMKRRQRAEEVAAKMKVKIIFPLVFCIFPCLFLVFLAPALLKLAQTFSPQFGK